MTTVSLQSHEFDPDWHIFGSQTFIHSDKNDYLVHDTQDGSFAFQEIGANLSETFINDRLYLGAQVL